MGPDPELVDKSGREMKVMAEEGNNSVCDSKDVLMECVSNYEDLNFDVQNFHDDRATVQYGNGDVEVNIVDCTKPVYCGQAEARSEDETESISSFGDTECEHENGSDIDSKFYLDGAPTSIIDGHGAVFRMRKKKLTDHWRRFVRPIMWRCKWLELQIMKFQSQALKYDMELDDLKQRKQLDSEIADDFHARALPFSSCDRRKKVMKRKKRKRFEETVDIASYVLQHNLFSYYENKKSAADGAYTNDDFNNPGKMNNENTELGFQNGFSSLESMIGENPHEGVLQKIEILQSSVRRLKAQIDNVMADNPIEFSTLSDMSLPTGRDALTIDQNPCLLPENRDRVPNTLSHLKSEFDTGDIEPQNAVAVSSHKEVAERIVVQEDAAKDEMTYPQNFASTSIEMLPLSIGKHSADSPAEMPVAHPRYSGKSLPKSRSNVLTKTRKRGRRKSGARRWTRRS